MYAHSPLCLCAKAKSHRSAERGLKGNQGTTVPELFYSLLAQDLRPVASSRGRRIFHDLRVVSVTVYALSRTVLVNYDLLFRDLLCLSMALCASHGGVTTGQRQVGLVMVKR